MPPVPPEIIEASYRGVNEQGCGSGSVFGIRIQEAKMTRIRIGLQHKTLDPDTEKMNTDPQPCVIPTIKFAYGIYAMHAV